MKTVLILHGIAGYAGVYWQQWLHDELVKLGYQVKMPTLPNADHPTRAEWLAAIANELHDVEPAELVIVGYSLGVPAALDYLEQVAPEPIHGLISVAGFLRDYGSELNNFYMRERTIDIPKVKEKLPKSVAILSDNDPYVTREALEEVPTVLGSERILIPGGGHFNTKAGYTEFPLVLEMVQSL